MRERSCGDPLARYPRLCPALLSGRSLTDRTFSSTHRRRIRVIGQVGTTADRAPRKWYASAALLSAFKCAGIYNWKDRRDTVTLFEGQENSSAGIVSTGCRWISFVPAIETIESRAQLISESFRCIHNWSKSVSVTRDHNLMWALPRTAFARWPNLQKRSSADFFCD